MAGASVAAGAAGSAGASVAAGAAGASVAAITIYDMCKAMSHEIEIRKTRLISKKGGKSDFKRT